MGCSQGNYLQCTLKGIKKGISPQREGESSKVELKKNASSASLTLWWVSPGRPFKEGNASLSREKTLLTAYRIMTFSGKHTENKSKMSQR